MSKGTVIQDLQLEVSNKEKLLDDLLKEQNGALDAVKEAQLSEDSTLYLKVKNRRDALPDLISDAQRELQNARIAYCQADLEETSKDLDSMAAQADTVLAVYDDAMTQANELAVTIREKQNAIMAAQKRLDVVTGKKLIYISPSSGNDSVAFLRMFRKGQN
jgi:hypothetical protein